MDQRHCYTVQGVAKNGTITYKCPSSDWALRKLRDLKAAKRQDITVTDADGQVLSEADLIGITEGSSVAPSEEAIPGAPQITRLPVAA